MNPKAKGAGGEYEVIEILQRVVDKVCLALGFAQVRLQRNLEQTRFRNSAEGRGLGNGSDVVGLEWMACEVKRVEQDTQGAKDAWWTQCKLAAMGGDGKTMVREPILFSRKNNRAWEVRLYGVLTASDRQRLRCPVDVSLPNFLVYFEERVKHEMQRKHLSRVVDEPEWEVQEIEDLGPGASLSTGNSAPSTPKMPHQRSILPHQVGDECSEMPHQPGKMLHSSPPPKKPWER